MPHHPRAPELTTLLEQCLVHAGAWEGTVYRFVTIPYANRGDLLSGAGARHLGGRWNPPDQFNAIYGSLDPEIAIAESLGTYSAFGISAEKARPRVFAAIRLKLQSVLDFASPRAAATLGLDYAALANESWQSLQDAGEEATTQALGRICFELQLEAILVPSLRKVDGKNIVLFPGRRLRGSSWKIQGARDLPRKD